MGLAANVDRKSMLPLVKIAIDEIFHNPKEIWWHGRAMDLMFNGIPIDCTSQKPQARVVCMVFRSGELQAIEKIDRTHFKFSLLGGVRTETKTEKNMQRTTRRIKERKIDRNSLIAICSLFRFSLSPSFSFHTSLQYNHTDSGKFEVNRGKRNARHIGRIVAVDGKRQLDVWNGQSCNEIRGTDGLVFPPFLKKSSHIWFFQKLVCRSFVMKFEKSGIKLTGIPVDKFSFDFGDIPGNKSQSCFCRKDGKCPFKGTMDLFPCLGAPMTLSLPHFYKADPVLLEAMGVGLKPNPKEHETFINFELVRTVSVCVWRLYCQWHHSFHSVGFQRWHKSPNRKSFSLFKWKNAFHRFVLFTFSSIWKWTNGWCVSIAIHVNSTIPNHMWITVPIVCML